MNVASTFSKLRLCGLMLGAAALLFGALARAGDPHDVARFMAGKSCPRCDLRYEIADGMVAEGIELRGSYMFSINLHRARFLGAQLQSSNLEGANLERADLSRANLTRAVLTSASLAGATLIGALMPQVIALEAIFDAADLSNADLTTAELRGSSFIFSFAEDTNFMSADLRGTNFNKARLSGAHFVNADLTGANFSAAPVCWLRICAVRAWLISTSRAATSRIPISPMWCLPGRT